MERQRRDRKGMENGDDECTNDSRGEDGRIKKKRLRREGREGVGKVKG
jgi:hypothetical protein